MPEGAPPGQDDGAGPQANPQGNIPQGGDIDADRAELARLRTRIAEFEASPAAQAQMNAQAYVMAKQEKDYPKSLPCLVKAGGYGVRLPDQKMGIPLFKGSANFVPIDIVNYFYQTHDNMPLSLFTQYATSSHARAHRNVKLSAGSKDLKESREYLDLCHRKDNLLSAQDWGSASSCFATLLGMICENPSDRFIEKNYRRHQLIVLHRFPNWPVMRQYDIEKRTELNQLMKSGQPIPSDFGSLDEEVLKRSAGTLLESIDNLYRTSEAIDQSECALVFRMDKKALDEKFPDYWKRERLLATGQNLIGCVHNGAMPKNSEFPTNFTLPTTPNFAAARPVSGLPDEKHSSGPRSKSGNSQNQGSSGTQKKQICICCNRYVTHLPSKCDVLNPSLERYTGDFPNQIRKIGGLRVCFTWNLGKPCTTCNEDCHTCSYDCPLKEPFLKHTH